MEKLNPGPLRSISTKLFLSLLSTLFALILIEQILKANLTEIAKTAKQKNIQVVFLTRPYHGSSNNPQIWKTYAAGYNQATSEVAQKEGVLLVDIYSYFKDKREYFVDESHFTVRGHRRAAEILQKTLLPLLPN